MKTNLPSWWVYKLRNHAGAVIYVGTTRASVKDRERDHRHHSPWWDEVDPEATTSQVFATQAEAQAAWQHALLIVRPKHNRDTRKVVEALATTTRKPRDPKQDSLGNAIANGYGTPDFIPAPRT